MKAALSSAGGRAFTAGQAQPKQQGFDTSTAYGQKPEVTYPPGPQKSPAGIDYSPGIGMQVVTDYQNQETGKTFQAPSSNYRPRRGSGWKRVQGPGPQEPPASEAKSAAYSAYSPTATQAPYAAYQPPPSPQQSAQAPAQAPSQAQAASVQRQPADSAAAIRDLLQGYGVPQNVMDQIGGMFGGQQGGQPAATGGDRAVPADTNPFVPSAQNFLPPPPVDPSWGSPGAQQQMFNNSMMAWTMPKQDLLQWGQQAAQMPWSPNYGNLPEQFRPSPYSIEPNNAFGVGAQGQQNRDAFIQSILNSQANQFTGTYQGNDNPGRFNQVNYDPSVLWQRATGLLNNGFVNPFLNPAGG